MSMPLTAGDAVPDETCAEYAGNILDVFEVGISLCRYTAIIPVLRCCSGIDNTYIILWCNVSQSFNYSIYRRVSVVLYHSTLPASAFLFMKNQNV